MPNLKKVSLICTTYKRYTCVQRIIAQFYQQSYPNKELIIFNTDVENPYSLSFEDENIIIINNNIDYLTGKEYTVRGPICRDAVTHATGDYFLLFDDDDIYLPWYIQQAVDGIESNRKLVWKPRKSFFANYQGIEVCSNTMESSVIVKMEKIREIGFRDDITGCESLSWYIALRDSGDIDEFNNNYIPSYCFNWSDPSELAGHKQSGDINNPNNFENHKLASKDYAKQPLTKGDIGDTYKKYYDYFIQNKEEFNLEYYEKYASQYL